MKIAFVNINANRREGTSRAIVEVAERLSARHDVTLVARTVEDVDLQRIKWKKITALSKPSVAEFSIFRRRAEKFLQDQKFDIIHSAGCNVWEADVYSIQTVHPKKFEIAKAVNRNSGISLPRRITRELFDMVVLHSERRSYKSFNKRGLIGYLPVSQGTEQELRQYFPVDRSLCQVIPNGADIDVFHPKLREIHRSEIRKELQLQENQILLLFAGGEWRRKELRLAIQALAATKNKDTILAVAGADPQRMDYVELVNQLGLQSRVRWLGFRNDIERLYGAADVFLFPSAYEAFSLATIEAAAVGVPVIMCEISGAFELLGDGTGGRIVARDPLAVATAIDEISSDTALRLKMSHDAREKVERLFNWNGIANQTEAFYERLLANR